LNGFDPLLNNYLFMKIAQIYAREILDSRGYPTVETIVRADNCYFSISSVPSGSSTGTYEAVEIRDGDSKRFGGYGVLKAINTINSIIAPAIVGMEVEEQEAIDKKMLEIDGTENKGKLGANAILSVSQAVLKLAALTAGKPLYAYIFQVYGLAKKYLMPHPTFNVINGGKHGNGKLEFQEFHIIPRNNQRFGEMLRMGTEVYLKLKEIMKDNGIYQGMGDEGGFTGDFRNNIEGLEYLETAIRKAGYNLNQDVKVGLDCAASEYYKNGGYQIADRAYPMDSEEVANYFRDLSQKYDWGYLEDPLSEDDWEAWSKLTGKLGKYTIVGDDLLVTNPRRVEKAIREKCCNAVLVKPNQIGTVTEVMEVIEKAKTANWKVVVSHRSGETNDVFIADLAVGIGADLVKFGAPARGERVAKYNRILEIERELGI
jgi:enolase